MFFGMNVALFVHCLYQSISKRTRNGYQEINIKALLTIFIFL